MAAWRRYPPAPIALRRLEKVLMAAHGLTQASEEPRTPEAPQEPPSPEQLHRALDAFNARFAGNIPRI